jgi:hypothetical protein
MDQRNRQFAEHMQPGAGGGAIEFANDMHIKLD